MLTFNFNDNGKYCFNLLDENLNIIMQSVFYETYDECEIALKIVQDSKLSNSIYFRKKTISNYFYFICISPFGDLIASSSLYSYSDQRDNVLNKVKKISLLATVIELFD